MSDDVAQGGGGVPSVSEVASAYVDGEVGADQAAWVAANRGSDADLAAELEAFTRVKALLGGLGTATPAAGGWDEIDAAVRSATAAESRRSLMARVSAVAAVAILVAAVAVGSVLVVGNSVPDPLPQATPAVLAPSSTRGGAARPDTGVVAAARGIGSVAERVGVTPRRPTTTSTTSTRPPLRNVAPPR